MATDTYADEQKAVEQLTNSRTKITTELAKLNLTGLPNPRFA